MPGTATRPPAEKRRAPTPRRRERRDPQQLLRDAAEHVCRADCKRRRLAAFALMAACAFLLATVLRHWPNLYRAAFWSLVGCAFSLLGIYASGDLGAKLEVDESEGYPRPHAVPTRVGLAFAGIFGVFAVTFLGLLAAAW